MAPPSPHLLDVTSAEQRFAQTVQTFIRSYDPRVQGTVARVAACWAREWVNLASPTLFPPEGLGLAEMTRQASCAHWRNYYQEHREHICQRRRERHQRRRMIQ